MQLEPIATMPKCHICGKSGAYTEMIDHTVYSAHPKCEHKLLSASYNVKIPRLFHVQEDGYIIKKELRSHLIDNHTKEALADLIVDSIY
jgi:hypothetical protein